MSERVLLSLSRLHGFSNADAHGFFMTIRQILLNVFGDVPEIAKELVEAIRQYEDAMLKADMKTSRIAKADREADEAWMALNAMVHAVCLSKNHERRAAAQRIDATFSKYENPTKLPYKREYALLENLLSDLAMCSTTDLETCYLIEPIQILQDACTAFHKTVAEVAEEKAQAVMGDVKMKKIALLDTWRKFVTRCNAMIEWQPDAKLAEFIDQANVIIAKDNATFAAQKTRKANKALADEA